MGRNKSLNGMTLSHYVEQPPFRVSKGVTRIEERLRYDMVTGKLHRDIAFNGITHPNPEHFEDYVFDPNPGFLFGSRTNNCLPGRWRKKTIEEREMEEAIKEVDAIAPGWKEEE